VTSAHGRNRRAGSPRLPRALVESRRGVEPSGASQRCLVGDGTRRTPIAWAARQRASGWPRRRSALVPMIRGGTVGSLGPSSHSEPHSGATPMLGQPANGTSASPLRRRLSLAHWAVPLALGLCACPPALGADLSGDAAGIRLAQRVDRAYRGVGAVEITGTLGGIPPSSQVAPMRAVAVLRGGIIRTVFVEARMPGHGAFMGLKTGKYDYRREPGRACWTRGPRSVDSGVGQPAFSERGHRYAAPQRRGGLLILRTVHGQTRDSYTIDPRTFRVIDTLSIDTRTQTRAQGRWRVLRVPPRLPRPAPICT
jgi:hypothetical protein